MSATYMKTGKKSRYYFLRPKEGISLVEFIIYVAISLFLVSTMFYWVVSAGIPLIHNGKHNTQRAQIYTAMQLLVHDISQAPAAISAWKKITDFELIWHINGDDIGWHLKNDSDLIRSKGVYNASAQKWIKKSGSLVATHIYKGQFQLKSANSMVQSVVFNGHIQDVKKYQKREFEHAVTFHENRRMIQNAEIDKSAQAGDGYMLAYEIMLKNRVVR